VPSSDGKSALSEQGISSGVLDMLASGTARLLATAEACGEQDVRAPSSLPGWTVAHVLTHLARNADSHLRRLEAASAGEVVPQYEGGRAARDAAIEAGAARPRDEIVEDLRYSCAELDRLIPTIPNEVWDTGVVEREHFRAPAATLPFTRVMEVEVHHVDLRRGYSHADWTRAFVELALPETMDRLARRATGVSGPDATWHLHRTDGVGEWLVRRSRAGSTVTAQHAKADCAVRGAGPSLLAWLLGRTGTDDAGLEVIGDASLAAGLPSIYPYG
jgi:maleylpyruvate isomerase